MERRLTAQEREVLRLHGSGHSPTEIARRLGISETTVAFIVGNLVGEWGAARTEDLARALSSARRDQLFTQFALPLAVMLVVTFATVVALGTTGTLHGPLFAPTASHSASPTTLGTPPPTSAPGQPGPSSTPDVPTPQAPNAADVNSPPAATPAPLPATPRLVTLPPALTIPPPTAAPSLPLPLPSLPTVPPLPTPTLPLTPPTLPPVLAPPRA
jgi:DNA-binding CsgD family transcriptional regulator